MQWINCPKYNLQDLKRNFIKSNKPKKKALFKALTDERVLSSHSTVEEIKAAAHEALSLEGLFPLLLRV